MRQTGRQVPKSSTSSKRTRDQSNLNARQHPLQTAALPPSGDAIATTVAGLGYELVDVERAPGGLLRVTIDRIPGRSYLSGEGESVTVDDCEAVTRQLQHVLEVDAVAYERLEVSSPGLDRPLKREADYERFAGHAVSVALRQPLNGRKAFKGVLARAGAGQGGWTLTFDDGKGGEQVLGFTLDEVRDARLVPVLDFKGRKGRNVGGAAEAAPQVTQDGDQDR
jgi:ribosome maturation factor RimP